MNSIRLASAAIAITSVLSVSEAHAEGTPGMCKVTECTTTPGYIPGAKRGDILFKNYNSATAGGITRILHAMGLDRTHVGMMVDTSYVRHNSMSETFLKSHVQRPSDAWAFLWGLSIGDVYIEPDALKNGGPGLKTRLAHDEWDLDGGGYYWHDLTILRPKDETSSRTRASNVAANLVATTSAYGVYAYSQWGHALSRDATSMCSGSIYNAWRTVEPSLAGGYRLVDQTREYRNEMADLVYGAVMNAVQETEGGDFWGFGTFTSVQEAVAAQSVGRQFVNAMAFGEFKNFDANWKLRMTTGSSISPDDLAEQGLTCSSKAMGATCTPSAARAYQGADVPSMPVRNSTTCTWVCYD